MVSAPPGTRFQSENEVWRSPLGTVQHNGNSGRQNTRYRLLGTKLKYRYQKGCYDSSPARSLIIGGSIGSPDKIDSWCQYFYPGVFKVLCVLGVVAANGFHQRIQPE